MDRKGVSHTLPPRYNTLCLVLYLSCHYFVHLNSAEKKIIDAIPYPVCFYEGIFCVIKNTT